MKSFFKRIKGSVNKVVSSGRCTKEEEARYGRACSLVLNRSVIVLRRVVEFCYTTQGVTSFESFLNNHKHDLFHLLYSQCCCGNKGTVTPLNKQQWQHLYVRLPGVNPHGQRRECPCKYTVIRGVTPDVMDVSLCCLVLRNICSGVSMPDVDTIREIRNQLIHASNASLDATSYRDIWTKVENAMLNLAKSVSSSFRRDTLKAIQELENRPMDVSEISALKVQIVNEGKRISSLEETQKNMREDFMLHVERVSFVEREIENIREDQTSRRSDVLQKEEFPGWRIEQLQQDLLKMNLKATQNIPVAPLHKLSKKLPLDLVFAPVRICQGLENKRMKSNLENSTTNLQNQRIRNPKDIFYKNGYPVRHIFMQGKAAHGKTVYCKQLLRHWCASKQAATNKYGLSDWEKSLDEFDFVFRIMFRQVNKDSLSVTDMIVDELSQHSPDCVDVMRHVLTDKKYRCLIIMDGLDEWRLSQNQKESLRRYGFPNIGHLSKSCSLFVTFRPWVYDVIADMVEDCDRVVNICGLDKNGITLVIENILVNFYNMDPASENFRETRRIMIEKSNDEKLKSVMEIPLLLTASVMLWFEKNHTTGGTMTNFYLSLVQLMIKRALDTKSLDQNLKMRLMTKSNSELHVPMILQKDRNKTLRTFIGVLNTLGKLAYEDLVSKETRLVFGKEELENRIDEDEMEFALKVGLLSHCEAPGCCDEENVAINFFHKTIQEFLAATHVICNKVEFCHQLDSIDLLFHLSNVVMFLSGLSPSLGNEISQHVANLANSDTEICRYREIFCGYLSHKMRLLFDLQVSCYHEMKDDTLDVIQFHGEDIYLDVNATDAKTIQRTVEILKNHHPIATLKILNVPADGENGISGPILSDFLKNTETLRSLHISGNFIDICSFGGLLPLKDLHLEQVTLSIDALRGLQNSLLSCRYIKTLALLNVTIKTSIDLENTERPQQVCLEDLLQAIPLCLNLTTLQIDHSSTSNTESLGLLTSGLPKLEHLRVLYYSGSGGTSSLASADFKHDLEFAGSLKNFSNLQLLIVWKISLMESHSKLTELIHAPTRHFSNEVTYSRCSKTMQPRPISSVLDTDGLSSRTCSVSVSKVSKPSDAPIRKEIEPIAPSELCAIEVDCRFKYHKAYRYFSMDDKSLELTSSWSHIQKVELRWVFMSSHGWYKFLVSLLDISHSFDVILDDTNIDEESLSMIQSCPCFIVKWEGKRVLRYSVDFRKVFSTLYRFSQFSMHSSVYPST